VSCRVRVDVRWYDSANEVVGKASMWVKHETIHWTGSRNAVTDDGWCGLTTG